MYKDMTALWGVLPSHAGTLPESCPPARAEQGRGEGCPPFPPVVFGLRSGICSVLRLCLIGLGKEKPVWRYSNIDMGPPRAGGPAARGVQQGLEMVQPGPSFLQAPCLQRLSWLFFSPLFLLALLKPHWSLVAPLPGT